MSDPVDNEIEAIKSVLEALTPLSPKARSSLLEYIIKRLDISTPDRGERHEPAVGTIPGRLSENKPTPTPAVVHIEQFKDQKKPRSANEMAALVAYYLTNIAPEDDRKETVNQKDIETYFKIAKFQLPKKIQFTLSNAKKTGYFDNTSEGEYKLSAVGHNLVVHSMPRGEGKKDGTKKPRKIKHRKRAHSANKPSK
jgi:hypothetical protein